MKNRFVAFPDECTHPTWFYSQPDVHEEIDSIFQQIHPVVSDFLDGASDLQGQAILRRGKVVDRIESGVEEDCRRGDVHGGNCGHQEGPVITTERRNIKCEIG